MKERPKGWCESGFEFSQSVHILTPGGRLFQKFGTIGLASIHMPHICFGIICPLGADIQKVQHNLHRDSRQPIGRFFIFVCNCDSLFLF